LVAHMIKILLVVPTVLLVITNNKLELCIVAAVQLYTVSRKQFELIILYYL